MTPLERELDSYGSWALAIAALREINIRAGSIRPSPDNPDEARQAVEGPVPHMRELDAVRRRDP